MKIDMTEIADRAVREALARHHALMREVIDRLANESGVIVHGVRHVNAARLLELLSPVAPPLVCQFCGVAWGDHWADFCIDKPQPEESA